MADDKSSIRQRRRSKRQCPAQRPPRGLAQILHPRRYPFARIRDALRRLKDVVDLLVARAERAEKRAETLKGAGQK